MARWVVYIGGGGEGFRPNVAWLLVQVARGEVRLREGGVRQRGLLTHATQTRSQRRRGSQLETRS